ncbi:hypothetical protein [Massilia aurea]|uniref:hypothetical protein n=1 Tax=Massilia aurea TaxID=373040 RepID=UPI001614EBB8|nr:hypothetical protein [Massilia aurea]
MNLALPALIAFLVLLPGFVFRSGLKRTESESLDFSPFGRVAAEGVLFSLILHAVWLSISSLVGFRLDPLTLMNLLSAHAATQARGNVQIASQFGAISAYFISLLVASHVVPALIRRAISTFKLDLSIRSLVPCFDFMTRPGTTCLLAPTLKSRMSLTSSTCPRSLR